MSIGQKRWPPRRDAAVEVQCLVARVRLLEARELPSMAVPACFFACHRCASRSVKQDGEHDQRFRSTAKDIHAGQCRIGATCRRGAAARPHGNQEERPLTDGTKPAVFTGVDSIAGAAITWKYLNAPPSDGAFQWLRFSTLNG